jgi:hypothetical protein
MNSVTSIGCRVSLVTGDLCGTSTATISALSGKCSRAVARSLALHGQRRKHLSSKLQSSRPAPHSPESYGNCTMDSSASQPSPPPTSTTPLVTFTAAVVGDPMDPTGTFTVPL